MGFTVFSYIHVLIALKSLQIHTTVFPSQCVQSNLCGTEFTVTGISDQSNSLARRPHLTSSIASTFDADNRDLASVIVWPTEEKSHSDCAELADIQRRRRVTCDRTGYSFICSFQYCSGLPLAAETRSALYRSSSSVTDRLDWLGAVDVAKVNKWSDTRLLFLPALFNFLITVAQHCQQMSLNMHVKYNTQSNNQHEF